MSTEHSEAAAEALFTEAAVDAVMGEDTGKPPLSLAHLAKIASFEVMLLVAELEDPSPAGIALRRAGAMALSADILRAMNTARRGDS